MNICQMCGTEFDGPRRKRYCSSGCAKRAAVEVGINIAQAPPLETNYNRKCATCDAPFETRHRGRLYCSDPCKRAAERLRRRDRTDRYIANTAAIETRDTTCPTCSRRYLNADFIVNRFGQVTTHCQRCNGV